MEMMGIVPKEAKVEEGDELTKPCLKGSAEQKQWMETVYDTRGGPSPELRKKILHHAHVHSCADAAAVKASISGTACPVSE